MIEKILKDLKELYTEKPNRLSHVLSVRDTALFFGKKFDLDLEKLEIAALLHDITKYYTDEENINLIKKKYSNYEDILSQYNNKILHSFSAAIVAEEKYGIKDSDILGSILNHTVGKAKMNKYEEIIFLSDYIEPNRTYSSCVKVREIAKTDFDLAIYTIIDDSIIFYEKEKSKIPLVAYQARDYYHKLLEEKHGKN